MKPRQIDLVNRCQAAIRHARRTCVFGSSNKKDDLRRTGGWVLSALKRYAKVELFVRASECIAPSLSLNGELKDDKLSLAQTRWVYTRKNGGTVYVVRSKDQHPLQDSRFNLTTGHREIFIGAFTAMVTRQGNCARLMCLAATFLWEKPAGINRIERLSLKDMDHTFLLVNREGDNLADSSTWGDAYIVDAWYGDGVVMHAKDYQTYKTGIKDFILKQNEYRKSLGFKVATMPDEVELVIICEIKPTIHLYPVYESDKKVEDYYQLIDYRYGPNHNVGLKIWMAYHRHLYQHCLQELKEKNLISNTGTNLRLC